MKLLETIVGLQITEPHFVNTEIQLRFSISFKVCSQSFFAVQNLSVFLSAIKKNSLPKRNAADVTSFLESREAMCGTASQSHPCLLLKLDQIPRTAGSTLFGSIVRIPSGQLTMYIQRALLCGGTGGASVWLLTFLPAGPLQNMAWIILQQ